MHAKDISHPNCGHHNWLVYRLNHRRLDALAGHIHGVVYDLGCGDKPYEAFFGARASRYLGVDWSNTPHDARADIVADLNAPLPIDDAVADTVVSISVLEHLSRPAQFLAEVRRILNADGRLILQVPFQWHIHEAPYDFFRFTPHGLEFLLGEAGFDIDSLEPCGGFFATVALKTNYFLRRFVRGPAPVRALAHLVMVPAWYLTQWGALLMDRFDRRAAQETQAYWVLARPASPTQPS